MVEEGLVDSDSVLCNQEQKPLLGLASHGLTLDNRLQYILQWTRLDLATPPAPDRALRSVRKYVLSEMNHVAKKIRSKFMPKIFA